MTAKIAAAERPPAAAPAAALDWHILTGEYPPQRGGVSDYTRMVARGLAEAGDHVIVWAPPAESGDQPDDSRVDVRRLPDRYGPRSLRLLSGALDRAARPRRVLVQYVPHAFGWKAANVPFCLWLRRRRRDRIWVMFHEVAYPFGLDGGITGNALAVVNRVMARLVAGAAERTFVSIPAWQAGVHAAAPAGTPITWLPVPSSVAVVDDQRAVNDVAERYGRGRPLVGHFGTYGSLIAPLLEGAIAVLLERADCRVLLMGHGSLEALDRLVARHPALRERVAATGSLAAADVSRCLRACAVMVQPYRDGISTRRTSAMAALAHGVPVVTTEGPLTEPMWRASNGVVLVPAGDMPALAGGVAALLVDPAGRAAAGRRGAALYDERFDLRHTIAALRSPA